MSLSRCKREHTYQEYLAWQQYLDDEYNQPSRTDHYLMQISCTLANLFSGKNAKRMKLSDFLIPFKWKATKPKSKQDKIAQSKSVWFGITGYKGDK